ncbi:MAG: hypothetical protein WD827_08250 [Solirubrobacterales bacterium]
MQPSKEELLAREERWSIPVALATLAGIGLLVVSAIVVRSVNGDGEAEILRAVHEHSSSITLSSILQAGAFVLLAAPLVYLFRAAQGRSSQVRGQLIGLIIAAPLFLSVAAVLNAAATNDAASEFVAGKATADLTVKEATGECRSERKDDGAKSFREEFGGKGTAAALRRCANTKVADEKATNAIDEAPSRDLATGFALGGRLGLTFALIYCCLHAMRAGLLTRFWGSLGMALGAAVLLLLVQFTLIWFLYFALLVAGWVPGGRPPAWAAGEAIPWPSPGEKAAAKLEGDGKPEDDAGNEPEESDSGERRKRKQRD